MKQPINPLDKNNVLPWEESAEVKSSGADYPGVSIVMPVYNAGRFIERTIRCLLLNDLEGCEVILMDGGSTDDTMKIARHYESVFTHIRSEPDKGQSDAINRGFALATKPVLHWLNGDDILLPNALHAVRKTYLEHPGVDVVVGNAYLTEIDFTPIHHFRFEPSKLETGHLLDYARNHLVQPSVFFSRSAWDTCGPVREDLHYSMDADLFIRMSRKTRMMAIDTDIAYSVYHEACKTRGSRAESIAELAYVQASHGGIEEARNTINILVDEFNRLKASTESSDEQPSKAGVLERRIKEMEADHRKNIELMMLADFNVES